MSPRPRAGRRRAPSSTPPLRPAPSAKATRATACARATTPIPMTFPASSWIGRTVASSTSTTRLAFSSITPMSVHVRYWFSTMKTRITPSSAVASAVVRAFLPGRMLSTANGLARRRSPPVPGSSRPARRHAAHRGSRIRLARSGRRPTCRKPRWGPSPESSLFRQPPRRAGRHSGPRVRAPGLARSRAVTASPTLSARCRSSVSRDVDPATTPTV